MASTQYLSIFINWNRKGNISHTFQSYAGITAQDQQFLVEALGLSAAMLAPQQLGVLTPVSSLRLWPQLLDTLARRYYRCKPINPALLSARIDLWLGPHDNHFHTFHPELDHSASETAIENAVGQFLLNYCGDLLNRLDKPLAHHLRVFIMLSMGYYLDKLSEERAQGQLLLIGANPQLQAQMRNWANTLYHDWESRDMRSIDLRTLSTDLQRQYKALRL